MKPYVFMFGLLYSIAGLAQGVAVSRPGRISIHAEPKLQPAQSYENQKSTKKNESVIHAKSAPKTNELISSEKIDKKLPTLILEKTFPQTATVNKFIISGIANDENGINIITVSNRVSKDFIENSNKFKFEVGLTAGTNEFRILAFDKFGNSTEKIISIIFAPKRNDYAVLFYVSEYGNGLGNLPGTKHDAELLATELRKFGFQTEIFGNQTADEMKAILERYANKTYAPDDQVLIYFSGHGRKKIIAGNITGELLCKNSSLSHSDFLTYSNGNCNHILLLTDACFSGISTTKADVDVAMVAFTKPTAEKEEIVNILLNAGKTRKILTSGEDATGTGIDNGASEFTRNFMNALQNTNQNSEIITIQDIFVNLQKQNTIKSGTFGSFGNGNSSDEPNSTFVFVKP